LSLVRVGPYSCKQIVDEEIVMIRAKDVMSTDLVTVKKDTPMLEAIELMLKNNISGMPVVEDNMTVAGVLSERDAVLLFYEGKASGHKLVSDFMTKPAVSFDGNESLLTVCDFLAKNIFRRVPITSKGRLIGIISVQDVLEFILKQKQVMLSTG
jgi:CBS domain-containing protein